MVRILIIVAVLLSTFAITTLATTAAEIKTHKGYNSTQSGYHKRHHHFQRHAHLGYRPARWCGWYMRTKFGGGPELNLARNWARVGRSSRPQPGAIVVWPHHVGEIIRVTGRMTAIVNSGNDGGAVRTRERSIAGAIAFRIL